MTNLDLTPGQRRESWEWLLAVLENYYTHTKDFKTAPELNIPDIRNFIAGGFDEASGIREALIHVVEGLEKYTVHTPHPGYYGLFNPRSNFPSILADTIAAYFNPQLAAWSHAPFAVEVEKKMVTELGVKFGYTADDCDGVFTTGGAEANLTALLSALNYYFPDYANNGLQSLAKQPVIYCSHESHHSIVKAAKIAGLGLNAVRTVSIDDRYQLSVPALEDLIADDLSKGNHPLMVVATMGTTGAGIIDSIGDIGAVAARHDIWLHADAAYGGALILSGRYKHLLNGIAQADSITFDAHKWMSVSMSGSLYLTRHRDILDKTFRVTADYMPKEASDLGITDPFSHSIQWSRRFIGLKLYLSMLVFGWKGYEETIDRSMAIGNYLRSQLVKNGWRIFNQTELPIVCFGKADFAAGDEALEICQHIIREGKAWISVYQLGGVNTLRACITNYNSGEKDILELVGMLGEAG